MSNEILYILLPDFASHEMVYLMEAISNDEQQLKPYPKYVNRIVAPTADLVSVRTTCQSASKCTISSTNEVSVPCFPRNKKYGLYN